MRTPKEIQDRIETLEHMIFLDNMSLQDDEDMICCEYTYKDIEINKEIIKELEWVLNTLL